jgi:hypothetical protein
MEELDKLIRAHIEESIEVYSTESKLLERSLLRLHRSEFGINVRLQTQK